MSITVVEVVEAGTGAPTTTENVVFSGTPADGELIVLVVHQDTGTTYTFPDGFTALGQSGVAQMAWKVASGEASATYAISSTVNQEMNVHGLRATKDAGATWDHLAGAGASSSGVDSATTGDANGAAATGEFLAFSSFSIETTVGVMSGSNTFGGTATGGTDTEGGDVDPSGSSIDVASTSAYRIFTGAGTVNATSKTFGSTGLVEGRVELFEEVPAAGGAVRVRRHLSTLGVGR